ncbi:hypothetical protein DSAG12_02441 [Promethearchaeum syntrophicum]|uniref:Uncharacterized protein n=1 Tax=Promethearchaeum syntrophicum TaxID=2594042 RepID=A0A5B9DC44_9ARCH|nr:hypothetical protein [Candidatus Prometheoarchaeum syntrophicum]QEE16611.1 hypothetical protein DSAG12_02441 [Candidatus Prometheoarchaeum syntrophicum]
MSFIIRKEKKQFDDDTLLKNFDEWSQSSIEKHDLYNFEVKLDYGLEKQFAKNIYELTSYVFIPNALQINNSTYTKSQFFADRNNYLRFRTARMSLTGLLNSENELSPFKMILINMNMIKNGNFDPEIIKKVSYELRVMGCIVKSNLRDQVEFFITNIANFEESPADYKSFILYLDDIKSLQIHMQNLRMEFQLIQIPEELKETFSFVDEYISNQIEEFMTLLLYKSNFNDETREKLVSLIEFEQKHKKQVNSKILIEKDSDNKSVVYWKSILKKFVQGVLYLDLNQKDEKSKPLEFLYSVAAGLAMFFSVLLGFFIVSQFQNQEWAYVVALVIVYMLKDRIKENIRTLFRGIVQKYYPDRSFEIFDNNNKMKIGSCKEIMDFIKWGEIPNEILQIREASHKTMIEREGKPEIVLKYSKIIELKTKNISENHKRHSNINDIIRFNIIDFLQYADDPITNEEFWDSEKKKVIKISSVKVYHLNIIFKMKMPNQQIKYKKIRVILDQKGIKEVKELTFVL